MPCRPVGWAETPSSFERKVRGSNLGPVNSDIALLPTARHRCIFFGRICVARAQCRVDGPCKLVTSFGVIQLIYCKIRFDAINCYLIKIRQMSMQQFANKVRREHYRWRRDIELNSNWHEQSKTCMSKDSVSCRWKVFSA